MKKVTSVAIEMVIQINSKNTVSFSMLRNNDFFKQKTGVVHWNENESTKNMEFSFWQCV